MEMTLQVTLRLPSSTEGEVQDLIALFPLAPRHKLLVAALQAGIRQLLKDPSQLLGVPAETHSDSPRLTESLQDSLRPRVSQNESPRPRVSQNESPRPAETHSDSKQVFITEPVERAEKLDGFRAALRASEVSIEPVVAVQHLDLPSDFEVNEDGDTIIEEPGDGGTVEDMLDGLFD